jgi:hypothetical protein
MKTKANKSLRKAQFGGNKIGVGSEVPALTKEQIAKKKRADALERIEDIRSDKKYKYERSKQDIVYGTPFGKSGVIKAKKMPAGKYGKKATVDNLSITWIKENMKKKPSTKKTLTKKVTGGASNKMSKYSSGGTANKSAGSNDTIKKAVAKTFVSKTTEKSLKNKKTASGFKKSFHPGNPAYENEYNLMLDRTDKEDLKYAMTGKYPKKTTKKASKELFGTVGRMKGYMNTYEKNKNKK